MYCLIGILWAHIFANIKKVEFSFALPNLLLDIFNAVKNHYVDLACYA